MFSRWAWCLLCVCVVPKAVSISSSLRRHLLVSFPAFCFPCVWDARKGSRSVLFIHLPDPQHGRVWRKGGSRRRWWEGTVIFSQASLQLKHWVNLKVKRWVLHWKLERKMVSFMRRAHRKGVGLTIFLFPQTLAHTVSSPQNPLCYGRSTVDQCSQFGRVLPYLPILWLLRANESCCSVSNSLIRHLSWGLLGWHLQWLQFLHTCVHPHISVCVLQ